MVFPAVSKSGSKYTVFLVGYFPLVLGTKYWNHKNVVVNILQNIYLCSCMHFFLLLNRNHDILKNAGNQTNVIPIPY